MVTHDATALNMIVIELRRSLGWWVFLFGTSIALVAGPTNKMVLGSRDGLAIEFIRLPAGEFMMGSPESPLSPWEKQDFEPPLHKVQVSGFSIAVHPITVGQFCAFLNAAGNNADVSKYANGVADIQKARGSWQPMADAKNTAVSGVTFDAAKAFCEWLTATTSVACRLPTEAEWEYAARGTDGRTYPWGNQPKFSNPYRRQIGTSPEYATPQGVQDMNGLVYQWCADTFDKAFYRNSPRMDPLCKVESAAQVVRGGLMLRWKDGQLHMPPGWKRFSHDRDDGEAMGIRVVVSDPVSKEGNLFEK